MNILKKSINNLIKKLHYKKLRKFKQIFNNILGEVRIGFVDIGASIQIIQRWKKIDKSNLDYFLFEPNKSEIKKLKENKKFYNCYKIFDVALSNKNHNKTLFITKGIYQTSFLKPNFSFLNKFKNVNRYKIVKKNNIKAKKLDDVKIENPDFIKIDVQGYNYEVVQGSNETLKNTIGIDIEVDFQQIYEKEIIYGKINDSLISKGFEFIDFTYLSRWERDKFQNNGQCVFGNALYLKKPEFILNKSSEIIKKYITISLLYNKFDLAKFVLKNTNKLKNKQEIFSEFHKLEKISNKSNIIKSISNGLVKFLDLDYNIHIFK